MVRQQRILREAELCLRGKQRWRGLPLGALRFLGRVSLRALPWRGGVGAAIAILHSAPLRAAAGPDISLGALNEHQGAIGISAVVALVLFTCVTALLHLTGRNTWTRREAELSEQLAEANARLERATVFLSAERQVVIAWGAAPADPDIEGELSLITDAPVARRVLGFGSWLSPALSQQMEAGVEKLRSRGEGFMLPLVALNGRRLEAEGRAIAGRAILRIRDVSGDRLELTLLRERHAQVSADLDAVKSLLDTIPDPVWLRDASDKLAWANQSYARAVEARDGAQAVLRGAEFMDQKARNASREARQPGSVWTLRSPAIVAGERRLFDLSDVEYACKLVTFGRPGLSTAENSTDTTGNFASPPIQASCNASSIRFA